jgi:heptosyltransferase-3
MRSILVIVTRQIGDVLLTTPLIRRARELWPHAAIDVAGFEGTLGMLDGNPDVRARIAMPARTRPGDAWRLLRRIWRRYDLALVAEASDRAHLVGWAASSVRSGLLPAEHRSNWWKRPLLRHAVTLEGDLAGTHVVEEKLRLLGPWSPAGAAWPPVVAPERAPLPPPLQAALPARYVVMHTPSMWPYKQWPVAHFRALAHRLAAEGQTLVLTGGPGAIDGECIAAMRGAAPPERLIEAGLLNFNQLVALLRGAALYIGPDTSVSHLAAACGIPVLAIFGPTNPQRWAPWPGAQDGQPVRFVRRAPVQAAGHVTLVQGPQACVPCGRAGCEDHRQSRADCLAAITPERVAEQALRLLR